MWLDTQQKNYITNSLLVMILQVKFVEERVSFLHFLTNVCAIMGGINSFLWIS
jgi:hypothetical protein